ncbi:cation:proton antiporter [Olivibacter sp. SDN3]|uniref:cation:proton antiporter n=1 Tax=Olivibacter sp. SDN3 TaxID=2764720 RepID=UPI001651B128|nr:cation:proton antiporter [Olivibacter sp. SDN3]QNL48426.1 cation:proton antiporter [Olivibacter sp. SDN3]
MNKNFFEHIAHAFETPLTNSVLIFSLILFIILLAPILLRKIKIPGIIGLILSGVVIGPHGLNILERSSAVELFSTIGLLYIMFIAGLELDMNEFRKTRHKSLVFGFYTFIIPILIGYPVCYYMLDFDMGASILVSSMFATHTLVAYPVVNSYGIAKNQAVAITIGGTILTDTAVLIILAVIVGSSQGQLDQQFWIKLTISFAVFLGIMFGIIPKIAKWFFQRVESEKTSHYIFVLLVVFFAAFMAEVSGLEPIIGAFVAGLALNKFIPHSSALMNRIEFIGNAIFIPFFLISVGMIVDVKVLYSGPAALIVAGTLTVVAILGKWIAAWFTQVTFKYSSAQRQVIFGLSSAHAAATLAIIMVGYANGIINENVLNGTIVLILITCIVASIVTETASKKVILAGEQDVISEDKDVLKDEHILVPIANLNNMEILLDFATMIKNKRSPHPVTILSVVPNNDLAEENLKRARKNLDSTAKYASGSEIEVNMMATIDYNIAGGISRASREIMADSILLGWPSQVGIIEKMVGEKTESILNRTDINIFMCHFGKPFVGNDRILLICPPMAEDEKGFSYWLNKLARLAQELTLPIFCIANQRSEHAILDYFKKNKVSATIKFLLHEVWDEFLSFKAYVKESDLLVFVSARAGEVSYQRMFDGIPKKLARKYEHNNRILVYPSRRPTSMFDNYEEVGAIPINSGLTHLQRVGKGLSNVLKIKVKNKVSNK